MPPLPHPLLTTFFLLSGLLPAALSQQPYGYAIDDCGNQHNDTGLLGYFCTAATAAPSCESYLTFHAQPPYTTVASISSLLDSDPATLAAANTAAAFANNAKVLVPVNCSCTAQRHYQHNTTYLVNASDTLQFIATKKFQGLSTCQAIQNQSLAGLSPERLLPGQTVMVPLRCACPSTSQAADGVRFLVSYLVDEFDDVTSIAARFGVNAETIAAANGLVGDLVIYPSTTLLIPVKSQPDSSKLSSPPPPPPPPAVAPSPPSKRKHSGVYIGIGVAVAVVAVVLSGIAALAVKARRRRAIDAVSASNGGRAKASSVAAGNVTVSVDDSMLSGLSDIGSSLKVYTCAELLTATDDFHPDRRIGGSVYRAVFKGDGAAVEVVDRDVSTEVEIMRKINHVNLIRLTGVCSHKGRWYLVSEYAKYGQLRERLLAGRTRHGEPPSGEHLEGAPPLSWGQRVQIALDVAEGLRYLHGYVQPPYVHMDISSRSVMLDAGFRAKIRNFGAARLIRGGDHRGEFTMTSRIAGTQGYMAPEYLEHGIISPKADVHALGVVMLELVTGKVVEELEDDGGGDPFAGLNALVEDDDEDDDNELVKLQEFVDPAMAGTCRREAVVMMVRLIERCVRREPARRPSMGEVAHYLLKLSGISADGLRSSGSGEEGRGTEE